MSGMHETSKLIRRQDSESTISNGLTNGHSKSPSLSANSDRNNNKKDKLSQNVQKKSTSTPPTLLPKPTRAKLNNRAAVVDDVQNSSTETIEVNQNKNGKGRHVSSNEATARANVTNQSYSNGATDDNECNHSGMSNNNSNSKCILMQLLCVCFFSAEQNSIIPFFLVEITFLMNKK